MATIEAKLGEDFIVVATNSYATDGERAPEFFTKSGWLSGYALGCGYVEKAADVWLSAEHGVFVVKTFVNTEAFESLNQARKEFVRLVKMGLREELQGLQAQAA